MLPGLKNKIGHYFLKLNVKNRLLRVSVLFILVFILISVISFVWVRQKKNINQERSGLSPKKATVSLLEGTEKISVKIPSFDSFEIEKPVFPEKKCNIRDYGAVSDGKTKNTNAFEKAITDCQKNGGGTVFVPKGTWLTGPIRLGSNINLNLEKDSEIIFTQNFEDYLPVVFTRFEGVEIYNFSPPIYAKDETNIAITGEGKINGNSKNFWWETNKKYETLLSLEKVYDMAKTNPPLERRVFGEKESGIRPSFIQFINCNRIMIEGVEINDGPMWTVHPIYSQNILIRHVSIRTEKGKNTDGVVIDSSRNALIEDSFFSTGDDSIAIKSGRDKDGQLVGKSSENIVARKINIEEAHSALAIGSEVSGGIKNIFASDFSIQSADFGFRIKSGPSRGSFVENIQLENFQLESSRVAGFEIDLSYGRDPEAPALPEDDPTNLENVSIKNFSSKKSSYPFYIRGHENKYPRNITFENIKINSKNDARLWNVENVSFENLDLYSEDKKKIPGIKTRNSRVVSLKDSSVKQNRIICEKEPCDISFE